MTELKAALEAVLFAAGESVPIPRLSLALGVEDMEVFRASEELAKEYERDNRGIRLVQLENRLQLCSSPEFASLIVKTLEQRKPPHLSPAALETLSIVAYYQPVTRALIEKMRGVDSSYTVTALQDRGLIEPVGKLDAPGRPTLFATTETFLRVMGIHNLDDLPPLPKSQGSEGTRELRESIARLQNDENNQQNLYEQADLLKEE
ncbi:MAG: SMC-Scp complex subunit ScpB [Oscillospiraceae bacterium]|nr:SMC-Scp complex subunit ScpB [Oscillospiraceae bacterium]